MDVRSVNQVQRSGDTQETNNDEKKLDDGSGVQRILQHPTFEPYVGKLERFELFSTNQCYYLVGCNKVNTSYRVLKMDRTLIERPAPAGTGPPHAPARPPSETPQGAGTEAQANVADSSHTAKPTLRPLSDFLTEDPNIYSQAEIREMLDMIHDGNRLTRADGKPDSSRSSGGGLKPLVKAYGVVGFIRFLDCYYLTLITRRAKVGSIGGSGIYTIKVCIVLTSSIALVLRSHRLIISPYLAEY